ncbi:MAG: endonuclease [Paludibacteraceae bacterium]|nr:endonuclease [Paludibacteraceae bacterium]
MKKHFITFFALALMTQVGLANVPTGVAAIPEGYYQTVNNKTGDAILEALKTQIDNHTEIAYGALEDYYEQTDFRGDTVWDMYSTCRFTIHDTGSQSYVCHTWNKEHSIPQSWFNKKTPMKSDLFHVYPTDSRVNNFRGNMPYGETNATTSGISQDPHNHALGKIGISSFSGYSGKIYEPDDEYKGDFARTYFYMVARYRNNTLNSSEGANVFTANPTNLTSYAQALFLKWHRQDPVSQKEIDRNEAVYGIQHNRNPFIDYPYLVEYIWGEKAGEKVAMEHLVASCDTIFIPGESDGWRSDVVPQRVEDADEVHAAKKVLVDGRIYIVIEGQWFTVMGEHVK